MCVDLKTYELFVRQKSTQFPPKTPYMRCPTYDKTGLKVLLRYSSDVITLRPQHSVTFRHILIRLKLPTAVIIVDNTLHRSRYRRPAGFAAIPSRLESGPITWTLLQTTAPLTSAGRAGGYQTVFQVAESFLW